MSWWLIDIILHRVQIIKFSNQNDFLPFTMYDTRIIIASYFYKNRYKIIRLQDWINVYIYKRGRHMMPRAIFFSYHFM